MKIFITGDSHTRAIQTGVELLVSQGEMPGDYQIDVQMLVGGDAMIKPYFVDKGDFVERIDNRAMIKKLPISGEQGTYDYYGICGPLHATRLWRVPNHWPNCTPFAPQGGQIPISTSLLRHVIFREQMYNMQLIEFFKRIGIKVFVIEAPKPYRHSRPMARVDPEILCYVDSYYKKIMMEWLASKEIPVIKVPGECYDANGFMHEKFRHDNPLDGMHANNHFGALMIKEVIAFMESRV